MLILLPPSETKADAPEGAPILDLAALSFSELNSARQSVLTHLTELSKTPEQAREVLSLSARQEPELLRNLQLTQRGTQPAIKTYTGVLYDALDQVYQDLASASGQPGTELVTDSRVQQEILIISALWAVVRAADPIAAYRLSGGTKLWAHQTMAKFWSTKLPEVLDDLAQHKIIFDLRSGIYQKFWTPPQTATAWLPVKVQKLVSGKLTVVSHLAKHTRGALAGALLRRADHVTTLPEVLSYLETVFPAWTFEIKPGTPAHLQELVVTIS